jgi:probable HAF family extracellular repeat protein
MSRVRNVHSILASSALFLVLALAQADNAYSAQSYSVSDIGSLIAIENSTVWSSSGLSINANGDAAGIAQTMYGSRAVVWTQGSAVVLPTLGGYNAGAYGINQEGNATGSSTLSSPPGDYSHAFVWDGSALTDIGVLGDGVGLNNVAEGFDINGQNKVVGWSLIKAGPDIWRPFLYANGHMQDLGTFGGSMGRAQSINDRDQVAGWSTNGAGNPQAFLWEDGQLIELGTLGGHSSAGMAINEDGTIVGYSTDEYADTRGFLWRQGQMEALATISDGSHTAYGINNAGEIVGNAVTVAGEAHAVYWKGGLVFDLNALLAPSDRDWTISEAFGINDKGQIIGNGRFRDGASTAIILSPVPEPSGFGLLLAGLGVLAVITRKNRRSPVQSATGLSRRV